MNETVGFIGLGTMGMPMASNLAKAGVKLVVHDVSAAARAAAGKLAGVTVASSAGAAAGQADVLFTCLPNDEIVRAAYLVLLADDRIAGEERKKLKDIAAALQIPEIHFGAILEDLAIWLAQQKS